MKQKLDTEVLLGLYRNMVTARRIDEVEADLGRQGEAKFHLSASGHEASAALAPHLVPEDWLHCHYRDKALMIARGLTPAHYLHGLLATDQADARGRRMPPFVCDRELHVLSQPTLVGNNALQAVGVAAEVRDQTAHPIVLCAMGDGGAQEGEVLEAIGEAVRSALPVLFVIEDNHYALSTVTAGRTFYSQPDGEAASFYGLPILRLDGSDAAACCAAYGRIVAEMRKDRKPRLVVLKVERLSHHSNSDDQTVYRKADELQRARAGDPIPRLAEDLRRAGVETARLDTIQAEVEKAIGEALAVARHAAAPRPGPTKRPLPDAMNGVAWEYRGEGKPALTMLEAMRETLRARIHEDRRVVLYGQDIEDPKGDVFGLTRGLTGASRGRVMNAPLAESTIIGASIGRALAGARPVAFLQFADFFPVAYNQLFSELGNMYWRTAGRWEAPVIVMAITGGYRPGLGPFHAQSPEAAMVQIPGADVLMPSTAADAAGLLNAAFESGRPTVFLYPKNLLNDRTIMTPADAARQRVPIGRARVVRAGRDLTLVGWGNTVALCETAAEALAAAGVEAEVVDLRSLSPWDRDVIVASAVRTGRMIVVHEDRSSCGLGAELIAAVAEDAPGRVRAARVTTPDTYIPYHYGNQLEVLPSVPRILEKAADLLEVDLSWKVPELPVEESGWVRAIGSSPSDEMIRITGLHVKNGQSVKAGDALFSAEADKASLDIAAPVDGTVVEVKVAVGDERPVGAPLLRLELAEGATAPSTVAAEPVPVFKPRRSVTAEPGSVGRRAARSDDATPVILSGIRSVLGSREMDNARFLHQFPEWSSADVTQRTGIERRFWIGEHEDALTLAVRAAQELLDSEHLLISDIDVMICSTGTPLSMTPSMACRILKALSPARGEVMVQAYDVNAACSGYLYALQNAYDLLKSQPDARVLLITTETLSPVLDHRDPVTLFLFGDAATASLIAREPGRGEAPARVFRPVLSAKGEDEKVLYVPFVGSGDYVTMEGQQVFRVAVRKMIEMLEKACAESEMPVKDLSMIVPHQANTRIIEAIRKSIHMPTERMFNHIRDYGNTSSNTIPLALQTVLPARAAGERIGLCAFGGGFTFGAGILERM